MATLNEHVGTSSCNDDDLNLVAEEHPTKTALMQHNNSVQGLVVLCQGLKTSSNKDLINVDEDPGKSM